MNFSLIFMSLLFFLLTNTKNAAHSKLLPVFDDDSDDDIANDNAEVQPPRLSPQDYQPPVIGIVSQLLDPNSNSPGDQFIAASYVKFIEGAGGLVVPLLLNHTEDYYYEIMQTLNGVLFPGGDANIDTGPYADAGHLIYRIALELNQNGTFFPVWGTCLGFEFISDAHVGHNWLTTCQALNVSLNVVFSPAIDRSHLFGGHAPLQVLQDLYSKNITINEHMYCLMYENFTDSGLDKDFRMLGTTVDLVGRTYVSAIEHITYPIFAVMWHPEKSIYETNFGYSYSHAPEAVRAAQYLASFFVNEARKSQHRFGSEQQLLDAVIQNYQPMYTGKMNSTTVYAAYWEQLYIFPWN